MNKLLKIALALVAFVVGMPAQVQAATAPTITTQPSNRTVTAPAGTTFAIIASGSPAPTFQWQRMPAGGTTWSNLSNGGSYGNVTTATLTVSATTSVLNGDKFRCVATNSAGSATGNAATLTVNKGTQSAVTISSASTVALGTAYTATATGGSGTGAIVWALSTGSTATGAAINATTGVVTFTSPGKVVFKAYRAADITYSQSATTANFTLTVGKKAQTAVTISSASTVAFGTAYTATATGGSGSGAIVWALGTGSTAAGAAINASTGAVTFTGAGTVIFKAYRAADTTYSQSATTANFALKVTPANQAPVVSITAPPEYSLFDLPATITITAAASDSDGTVAKVEFYKNSVATENKIGEKTSAPYTINWAAVAPGSISLIAVATDNLGTTKNSLPVGIQLRPTLPYTADFELSEGYKLGSLDNQLGWIVTTGAAQIVNTIAASGTQSVVLSPGAAARVEQEFGPSVPPPSAIYVDFFTKPVAGADTDTGTLYETDVAQLAFIQSGTSGQFAVLDGDGNGDGTWLNLPLPIAVDASHVATAWQRLTLRIDFAAKTWDLFLNGQLLAPDLGFRLDSASALSLFALRGNTASATNFDDFYVGAGSPLFTDTNADGIDDAWETAHGLNLGTNQRVLDPDNDGLTNLQEYEHSTNPRNADTDGDGLTDGVEIAAGTNPLVADSSGPVLPVSGARLHLRADLGVVADGAGFVSRWHDLSGHGNDAVQTEPYWQPSVIPAQLGVYPVIRFNQAQQNSLALPDLMAGATGGEAFVVLRKSDTSIVGLWSFGAGPGSRYPESNGVLNDDFGTTQWYDTGPAPSEDILREFHFYNVGGSTTTWFQSFNGVEHYRHDSNSVGFRSNPSLGDGQGCNFDGEIAEIIVYDRVLSDPDRELVGRYLAQKYRPATIPVPQKPALTAYRVSGTTADLAWTESTGSPMRTVATIERQAGGGSFERVKTLTNSDRFTDTDLIPGQSYIYRVTLGSWIGDSPVSEPVPVVASSAQDFSKVGMRLWLRATTGLTGTALISRWADQSPAGNDAVQSDVSLQPRIAVAAVGGMPAVRFDGSMLGLPNLMAGATEGEIFAVMQVDFQDDWTSFWSFGQGWGAQYYGDSRVDDFGTGNVDMYPGAPRSVRSQFHLQNLSAGGGSWVDRVNGVRIKQRTLETGLFREIPFLGMPNFHGSFAEIIVYDRVLSDAERDLVGRSLTQKYQPATIPVPQKPVLMAYVVSGTTVDLGWIVPTASTMHTVATIERQVGSGAFAVLDTVTDTQSYTDTGLAANQSYTYRLTLTSWAGPSPLSDPVTVVSGDFPNPPSDGLRLWLRASAGLPAAGGVAKWADQSGHGNDALQPEPYRQPDLVAGQLNGYPAVHFDRTRSTALNLPEFMDGAAAGEIIAVLRKSNIPEVVGPWSLGAAGGSRYPEGDGTLRDDFATNEWTVPGPAPAQESLTQFHVYGVAGDGNGWHQFFNGREHFQRVGNTVGFRGNPILGDAQGCSFDGDFVEVIAFDRVLSAAERTAINSYLSAKYACSFSDYDAPSVPSDLAAYDIAPDSFNLYWTASTDNIGVVAYDVYDGTTLMGSSATAPFHAVGLSPSTAYSVTVKARDAAGNPSAGSLPLAVTTQADTDAPSIPASLAATDIAFTSFTLSWSPSTDSLGTVGYQIFNDGVLAGSTNSTTFDVTGLFPGTSYVMTVTAGDSSGNSSAASAPKSVKTSVDTTAPGAPTSLVSSAVAASSFTLKWTAPTDNVAVESYEVFKDGLLIGTATSPSFDVVSLTVATTYVMTVKARDHSNNGSIASAPLSVTTVLDTLAPSKPIGLAASRLLGTSFKLVWAPAADDIGVDRYDVYLDGVLIGSSEDPTLMVQGLLPLTTYALTVKATDGSGNVSVVSDPLSVKTADDPGAFAGLRLWLKADTGATPDDTGRLGVWSDLSPLGNDAVQTESDRKPIVVANQSNGRPVVRFSGNNEVLILPDVMAGATGGEIIAVVKVVDKPNGGFWDQNNKLWSFGQNGTGYTKRPGDTTYFHYNDFGMAQGELDLVLPDSVVADYHIVDTAVSADRFVEYFNGVLFKSAPGHAVSFGSQPDLGSGIFAGDFAEILVFDRTLSDLERETIGHYLGRKFRPTSIPVPAKPSLSAFAVSGTKIDLNWSLPSTIPTHTQATIERQTAGGSFAVVATLNDVSSFTDAGLVANQSYTYRLTLASWAGSSLPSEPVTIVTPNVPDLPALGLRLWLRASAGLPYAGGVGKWPDQSGLGNDALQSEPDWQPSVIPAQFGGYPVVHFNQAQHNALGLPNLMREATEGEAFVVLRKTGTSIVGLWSFGTGPGSRYPEYTGILIDDFATNQNYDTGRTPTEAMLRDFHLYNVGGDATTWFQAFNGVEHYRHDGNSVGFRSNPSLGDGQGCNFDGDIAEVIVYDRVLTDAERESVGRCLTLKYQQTIITGPPKPALTAYRVSGTTVDLAWTESTGTSMRTVATIERQTGGGSFELVKALTNSDRFTDTGLIPGQSYIYRVTLGSWIGDSPVSEPVLVPASSVLDMSKVGMRLWLRATIGLTGTERVSSWADQSSAGNDAVQSNVSLQPQIAVAAVGGLPAVRFDGDILSLPNVMAGATEGEIFAVMRVDFQDEWSAFWSFGQGWGSQYYGDNRVDDFGSANADMYPGAPRSVRSQFHLQNVSAGGGTWVDRVNGVEIKRRALDTGLFRETPFLGMPNFHGSIAEIIVYDRVLAEAERRSMNTYFGSKFGLPDSVAPTEPKDVVASMVSAGSFTITWSPSTDDRTVAGYVIYSNGLVAGFASANSYVVRGLVPNTTYLITVVARDAEGNESIPSASLPVATCIDTLPPSVPSGLQISAITSTSFTLTWLPSTDDGTVTSYEVFLGGTLIGTSVMPRFEVTNLIAFTTYNLTVRAKDAAGRYSALNTPLSVTPKPPWPWASDLTGDSDSDGAPNAQDALPADPAIGRLTIFITVPATGSTIP